MILEGKRVDTKISTELLENKEKMWHKKMPESFKSFIENNNGLIPNNKIVISEDIVIERFLCILDSFADTEDGIYDIDVVLSKYFEYMVFSEDTLGYDLIPFAKLNRDKLLCLCYDRPEPSVCIWNFEGSADFNPNYSVKYESFKEFLEAIS